MEFELLRLPPQSKTVGPWTFQQGGRGRRRDGQDCVHPCITLFHTCAQRVKVACRMSCVCIRNVFNSLCSPILVSFHLLSLCPPLPTDNTYTLHCVSTCSPVVQFLRVASRCSPTLLTPEVPQPQPEDSSRCRGEGQGRGILHQHRGTQQDHPSTSHPSETRHGDVCGAVICEECVGVSGCGCGWVWVCVYM